MFCPNCGEKIVFEQVYCRSCGIGISEMSQSLLKYNADLEGKTDWLNRIGLFSIGIISSGIIGFILVVFAEAFKMKPIPFVILMITTFAILQGILFVLYFEKNKSKKTKIEIENKDYVKPSIENWKTNKKLNESSFKPIGSVTDNTTELFTAEPLRRKTSGELG